MQKYADYIEKIEIESLWSGRRHVVWELDRKVNILSGINGMGKLAYDSLIRRDYTQVQAIILVVALVYIIINLVVDILYKVFDPRVELS